MRPKQIHETTIIAGTLLSMLMVTCLANEQLMTSFYPKIFGGSSGDSEFTTLDTDTYNDIIAGGWTSDASLSG
jgi:hypothetical protein